MLEDGKVGIGSYNPKGALHVNAKSSGGTKFVMEDHGHSGAGKMWFANVEAGDMSFNECSNADGSWCASKQRVTLVSGGNVGIGTVDPTAPLEISYAGGASTGLKVKGSANRAKLVVSDTDTSAYLIAEDSYVSIGGGDSWRATNLNIHTTTGNVGIGVKSPASPLHIVANMGFAGSLAESKTKAGFYLNSNANQGSNGLTIGEDTGTGSYFISNSNGPGTGSYPINLNPWGGNVGIGTSSFCTACSTPQPVDSHNRVLLLHNFMTGTTEPDAPLDVKAASDFKVTKFGDDITSHYVMTGHSDHTLTLTCGSYFQAEIVITAHQTNGGPYNNLYIRGIWSNNHHSHHWDELENVGYLSGSTFTITKGQNGDTANSGEWKIVHDYVTPGSSFVKLTVRVTDFYGGHNYN